MNTHPTSVRTALAGAHTRSPRQTFCRRALQLACAMLLPSMALAQAPTVFKWTDAQGVVHYSERAPTQGGAPAVPLNVKVNARHKPPAPAPSAPDTFAEQFRRQAEAKPPSPAGPAASRPRVVSESNGTENGSDASRCALARDILKGVLRHANGKPIDQYDLDTARNDIRMFCRPN